MATPALRISAWLQSTYPLVVFAGEKTFRFLPRPEQERRERGRECQRVEGRDEYRDCDRQSELLVEPTLNAAHERNWQEDRREDQRDADHRPGDLLHRLRRCIDRRHPFLDMTLDRLHDHNRVIHDQANGEHEREQRQRVDREAQERKRGEGPNERHRHGNDRAERRANSAGRGRRR